MAGVTLEHVGKVFADRRRTVRALHDFNLAISDHELVVLVGPSGCGKTTTLRLISGLEEVTEGAIRIGDRVVNRMAPKDRDIAMVFQNHALYPHLSVYANLAFGLKMRRVPRSQIKTRVREVADLLGITPLLAQRPGALSGGECQRVALGRAIIRKPHVFLLDEPLSNLDATHRVTMRTEIKSLQRRLRTTMIYVTHDQEEAMTLGDRLVVMRDGTIQQVGTPMEVYERPVNSFVGGFIGMPPMNFLRGKVNSERTGAALQGLNAPLRFPAFRERPIPCVAGQEIMLGIRPEHVRIETEFDAGRDERSDGFLPLGGARVALLEPLGDRMTVHLTLDGPISVAAKAPTEARLAIGEVVHVSVLTTRIHFFAGDGEGRRID